MRLRGAVLGTWSISSTCILSALDVRTGPAPPPHAVTGFHLLHGCKCPSGACWNPANGPANGRHGSGVVQLLSRSLLASSPGPSVLLALCPRSGSLGPPVLPWLSLSWASLPLELALLHLANKCEFQKTIDFFFNVNIPCAVLGICFYYKSMCSLSEIRI